MPAAVVVLAGGSGSRAAATIDGAPANKVYLPLAGRPVLAWSLHWAAQVSSVERLVLVVRAEDEPLARQLVRDHPLPRPIDVVAGGASRHDSEMAAFTHLGPAVRSGEIDVIAVHDAARPLAGSELFGEVIETAVRHGGGVPAVSADGLLTRDGGPRPDADAPDTRIVRVQTPQAFRAGALLDAYELAAQWDFRGTDTASCVQAWSRLEIRVVDAQRTNLKITYPGDLAAAERLLALVHPTT